MNKFKCNIELSDINDSMELESGQEIARLEENGYAVTLEVQGDVRVVYKDVAYRHAGAMPDELLKLFHDGKAYESEDVYVDMNNWFEVFFWEKKGDKLVWTGWSDVVDCEGMNEKELEGFLIDCMNDFTEEM